MQKTLILLVVLLECKTWSQPKVEHRLKGTEDVSEKKKLQRG
jgi:hypothetical protein